MISVILDFETGAQREVLLSGVPRVGEHIRLRKTSPNERSLVVLHVLWIEGGNGSQEPSVIVSVRPRDPA